DHPVAQGPQGRRYAPDTGEHVRSDAALSAGSASRTGGSTYSIRRTIGSRDLVHNPAITTPSSGIPMTIWLSVVQGRSSGRLISAPSMAAPTIPPSTTPSPTPSKLTVPA